MKKLVLFAAIVVAVAFSSCKKEAAAPVDEATPIEATSPEPEATPVDEATPVEGEVAPEIVPDDAPAPAE
jgi:uncharacterized protein YcgI (DUF1989 family)